MWYLSFDCAAKNMGVVFYKYNDNYMQQINKLLKTNFLTINELKSNIQLIYKTITKPTEILKELIEILNNIIEIKFFKLIDTVNDKKLKNTNIIDRTLNLKSQLNEIELLIKSENIKEYINLHIEYQMNINNCSLAIMNQLIYHYTFVESIESHSQNKYKIQVIYPAYKNKLYFHENLKHRVFIQRYNSNYKSNKEHSKYNLLYYLYVFKKHRLIQNFSLKKIDDLADSFLQSLANLR